MLESLVVSLQLAMNNVDVEKSTAALHRAINTNISQQIDVNANANPTNSMLIESNALISHANTMHIEKNAMTTDIVGVNALIS